MALAITFPGQGSQSQGMLSALSEIFPEVRQTFDEGSVQLGEDLWELSQLGPIEKLNKTEFTQPLLLAAGVACWRVWQAKNGVKPEFLAGHSLGEYTALVCAKSLELGDAIKLVNKRGQLMQSAVAEGEGAMAAILGLNDQQVDETCQHISTDEACVSAVNFNSPGQVVIAGDKASVETAINALKEAGAKRAMILPVSVPSHCRLMLPAAEKLAEYLQTIHLRDAEVPVIQNVDVKVRTDSDEIKKSLIEQLYQPVRWSETIIELKSKGVDKIIECGPGKVLTGLCKRIDRALDARALFDIDSLEHALND